MSTCHRLLETAKPRKLQSSLVKQAVRGCLNFITRKEDEKRKLCKNLNV